LRARNSGLRASVVTHPNKYVYGIHYIFDARYDLKRKRLFMISYVEKCGEKYIFVSVHNTLSHIENGYLINAVVLSWYVHIVVHFSNSKLVHTKTRYFWLEQFVPSIKNVLKARSRHHTSTSYAVNMYSSSVVCPHEDEY
jgi:hypothetical protein